MDSLLRSAVNVASASLKQGPKKVTDMDEELEQLISKQKAKIKVIGVGGSRYCRY